MRKLSLDGGRYVGSNYQALSSGEVGTVLQTEMSSASTRYLPVSMRIPAKSLFTAYKPIFIPQSHSHNSLSQSSRISFAASLPSLLFSAYLSTLALQCRLSPYYLDCL
ncbi:hypothetical protein V6Z90_005060 [Aspergillus fumigatus]